MKLKIFLLLIIIFTISFIPKKIETNAEALRDLSFSKGENLLDPKWFSYKDDETLYSRKKTYLKYGPGTIYFQLEESFLGNIPNVSVELYDIGFNSLGVLYSEIQYGLTECGDYNYGTACFDLSEYENAISFTFTFYPILFDEYRATDVELMCFYGNEPKDGYIEYEDAIGLFDISTDHPAIEVEYDYPLDIDDIKELLESYDSYDGNITELLTIDASNYFNNLNKLGRYTINVKSKDSSNNETTGFFYIDVVDYLDPVIVGPDKLEIPIYTEITDEYILNNYTAADGYDGDITENIEILSNYTKNPTNKTSEKINLKIIDSSNNEYIKEIEMVIYDNVPPVLTCPESIEYSYEVNMTLENIIAEHVVATDNIETDILSLTITKNTYTGNEKKVGEYEVEISVKDESQNETKKTMTIKVSDKIKPVIFINTYNLEVTSSVNLERLDFDNLLYEWGILKKEKKYVVNIMVDTYTGHENEEGKYIVSIKYTDEEQAEIIRNFMINVKNDAYIIEPVVEKSKSMNLYFIIISSTILTIGGLCALIIIKKKKKRI